MNWKPLKAVDYIVIHCSATPAKMDIGAEEIRQWHLEREFVDIGYHFVIRRDGTVEEGRPMNRPGAHARGFNHISIGVCLVGGVARNGKSPENNFTDLQWRSLGALVETLKYHNPDATVLGHRDLPNVKKGCPSFDVGSWWQEHLNGRRSG